MSPDTALLPDSVRILFLAEREDDALVLVHELRRSGLRVEHQRVDTREGMQAALVSRSWEIVLAVHGSRRFSVAGALAMLDERELPLIVAGALDEHEAAELRGAGAHDVVLERDRHRLAAVIEKEIRRARKRRARRTAQPKGRRGESRLHEADRRLRHHVDNSPLAILEWDRGLSLQRWSEQAERTFGWSAEQALGRGAGELPLIHEEDIELWHESMSELMQARQPRNVVKVRSYTAVGKVIQCEWYNSALFDDVTGLVSILSLVSDVTESQRISEQLSYQERHDPLTGLLNRREFERRVHEALEVARTDGVEHLLCYLDLDSFKVVNDTCGHLAGDELLKTLGTLLPQSVRQQDTVARLGGDEFAFLLSHCPLAQARKVAGKILDAFDAFRFEWEGQTFSVGASMGIAPLSADSEHVTDVLAKADSACHLAKTSAGNRVYVYQKGDAELETQTDKMRWVARIQEALDQDRFVLYYQPIAPVEAEEESGHHYELLVRMLAEDGSTVSPGMFLPAAEQYGLAPKLDAWVVEAALRWLAAQPRHVERLYLCGINLSGHSLSDERFLKYLVDRVHECPHLAQKLCFEITETAAIANLAQANRFINVLRGLGCRFALDDFGTGLSSFTYLKSLPVDFLKIDGSFVRNILKDPMELAVVKSINEIAQAMGKKTIAEFVENQAILEKLKLRYIGVDYVQGYHIGAPRPLNQFNRSDDESASESRATRA